MKKEISIVFTVEVKKERVGDLEMYVAIHEPSAIAAQGDTEEEAIDILKDTIYAQLCLETFLKREGIIKKS